MTVSYYELVQNLNYDHWSTADVHAKLDAKITRSFHQVLTVVKENKGVDMRTAAYMVAINRVADTMRLRGLPL